MYVNGSECYKKCLSPCHYSALLPHDTEVHGHGDGELLVIDREDVKNLNIDINVDRGVWSGGLQLLIVDR